MAAILSLWNQVPVVCDGMAGIRLNVVLRGMRDTGNISRYLVRVGRSGLGLAEAFREMDQHGTGEIRFDRVFDISGSFQRCQLRLTYCFCRHNAAKRLPFVPMLGRLRGGFTFRQ